jgi:Protein of unknown function (DUF3631)/Domain of unknown function (DUF3854)
MIADHHLAMLAASGITPEHAAARGYETIRDPRRLAQLGIARAGQRTQGLLVPQLRAEGSTWGHQYRPDSPRERNGKLVKYETPIGQRNGIDVPPGVGPMLGNIEVPLWITEGVKKADCGALHGLCIVALPGVWSWRGKNNSGGKLAVGDWHDIALNDRRVILAFDGDVARKPEVRRALSALADYLTSKGAHVEYLHLPDTDDKTGLDDYLADHTVEDLWRLVKPTQPVPKRETPGDTSKPEAPKPKPVPEPVDGAELLDDIDDYLARFVVYPSEHERRAHTLWIAHTWLMDCWESTPRIAFLSPEPGSGKSRALEVTEPLVPRPVHAVNTTSAYLFRKVADPEGKPTILYDEIDTVFGPKAKENEDIRGMLNAGHRKGAVAGRCVVRGKIIETEELDAYCAVMLAGLDDLPDTLMSRSVVVRMQRRAPSEPVEPWRPRVNGPDAHALRDRIAAWAASVKEAATDVWPEMPPGVQDRNADVWEALLAVADLAGGHLPTTSRVAAVTAVTVSTSGAPSLGVMLLRDIRDVFNKLDVCNCVTDQLLADLRGIEESPWAVIRKGEPLNASGLARRLGKYGIGPKAIRDGNQVFKGYARAQFEDAWMRYVDPPGPPDVEAVTAVTRVTSGATDSVGDPPQGSVTSVTAVRSTDSDISDSDTEELSYQYGDPCTVCTKPQLWSEASMRRGICESCWLTTNKDNDQPEEGAA